MALRVLAGELKGRKLRSPPGRDIRPTTGIVKEHIFAVLQARIPGARLLDLFAGTGGLGLEALSRGARSVVFVESARAHLPVLRENITHLHVDVRTEVAAVEVPAFLETAPGRYDPFDLVLADPPFRWDHLDVLCRLVGEPGLLAETGVFVVEHALPLPPVDVHPGLTLWRTKSFGGNIVSMFQKAGAHEDRGVSGHV